MEAVSKFVASIERCSSSASISLETGAIVCTLRTYCLCDDEVITRMLEIQAKLIDLENHSPHVDYAIQRLDYLMESCFQVKPTTSRISEFV